MLFTLGKKLLEGIVITFEKLVCLTGGRRVGKWTGRRGRACVTLWL